MTAVGIFAIIASDLMEGIKSDAQIDTLSGLFNRRGFEPRALNNDRYVISLCHGPAGLLAAGMGEAEEDFLFRDYEMCVFPDSLDTGANIDIGYIPGPMPWLLGERLRELGVKIVNSDITGKVHRDRRLLTGDSPLAANNLGKLAAETLLADVATR